MRLPVTVLRVSVYSLTPTAVAGRTPFVHAGMNCAGIGNAIKADGKDKRLRLTDLVKIINVKLVGTFDVFRLTAQAIPTNETVDGVRHPRWPISARQTSLGHPGKNVTSQLLVFGHRSQRRIACARRQPSRICAAKGLAVGQRDVVGTGTRLR